MSKTFQFFIWSGKKAVAFLVLTVALSVAIVGTTLAYIIVKTNELNNTFTPGEVKIEIAGDDITNTGDTDVYVRAAVVINWVDGDGVILSTMPVAGVDYDIVFNEDTASTSGWVQGSDTFWYYVDTPLEAGKTANALINSITQKTTKDGYTLRVQVLSSAIQATPTEAVVGAWTSVTGVDASGKLTIETTNP